MKAFVLAAAVGLSATLAAAQDYTLRFAHQLPPQHYLAQEYEVWAKAIEEKSGGKVKVEIFPAAQAFKPNQVFPAVAQGRIEAGMSMSFQWGNTIPEMAVMTVPYVMSDEKDAAAFVKSEANDILEGLLEAKGVQNLAWLYMGNVTTILSKDKPIISPEDLKGVRIRGLDQVFDAGIHEVGGEAVIMPGSEVYQALQTGIVSAAVGDLLGIVSRKYYEVQNYANVVASNTVFSHIIVNPGWYAGLDDNARKAVDEASEELQARLIADFPNKAAAGWEAAKDKITLHRQTPEEAKAWEAALQPASIKVFLAAAPDNGQKLLDALKKLKE
ncbi:MAG: TRAP transporter substrate-binding protein DctP [Pseudooceanicola sp.]|nr:TRAP transporter substrate-binding protein DctP [Pseudooceanicola sp.]